MEAEVNCFNELVASFVENPYCFVFWNIDDAVSYITEYFLLGLKYTFSLFKDMVDNSLVSLLYQNYWYRHMLVGAPDSTEFYVFEVSLMADLINFTKNITSNIYISLDVVPVNGSLFAYLLEHPEVCAYLTRFEHNYYFEYVTNLYFAYLNSRFYYIFDTATIVFSNLSLLFIF
jgi:hypothetical protein